VTNTSKTFFCCLSVNVLLNNITFLWFLLFLCAETAISKLLTKILTTPLYSATVVFCKNRKFRRSESIYSRFCQFSLRMHRNAVISTSGLKSVVTIILRDRFLIKAPKVWQFCNILVDFWPYFTAHVQKR